MKEELLKIDREFARVSVEKGAQYAFSLFSAADVISYQQQTAPFVGRDNLVKSFDDFPEDACLDWKPYFADIAESGEMGYTLGHYIMTVPQKDGSTKVSEGNYVTIWKKQADGSWKFVFDSGAIGPAPEEFK